MKCLSLFCTETPELFVLRFEIFELFNLPYVDWEYESGKEEEEEPVPTDEEEATEEELEESDEDEEEDEEVVEESVDEELLVGTELESV